MAKYRKKPVVIEAVKWYGKYDDGTEWPDWIRDAVDAGTILLHQDDDGPVQANIQTLEGVMSVAIDDFIIQGVKGEIYPCKPDIFDATYDYVGELNGHFNS